MPIPFGMSLSFRHLGPFWTLLFTNLALLISALIQAGNETISYYNAIIVICLCFLHSLSSLFVLNILHWVHRKKVGDIFSLLSWLQLLVLAGLLHFVGSHKGFGSRPECNSAVNVKPPLAFCQWLTFDSSGCPLTFL